MERKATRAVLTSVPLFFTTDVDWSVEKKKAIVLDIPSYFSPEHPLVALSRSSIQTLT